MALEIDVVAGRVTCRGVTLEGIAPLIDGEIPPHGPAEIVAGEIRWQLETGAAILAVEGNSGLQFRLEGVTKTIDSLGVRFSEIRGVRRYLRNGYQSWDGSFFVEPGTQTGGGPPAKTPPLGFAILPFPWDS